MASDATERLRFFQGQYLGAEDFDDLQAYHRTWRRRHNLGPHTPGIVTGLRLVEVPQETGDARDVYVQPGLAVDGYGREILVTASHPLDTADFERFLDKRHREVWIAYDQDPAQPSTGGRAACRDDEGFTRIREGFRIVVGAVAEEHSEIIVAGEPVEEGSDPSDLVSPPDHAVPHQTFPDDEDSGIVWLVRLGSVHWDGLNGEIVAADEGRLDEGRHYAGNVTAALLAPNAQLRIADRWNPGPLPRLGHADYVADDGVAVTVEGALTVERLLTALDDVQIHGGKVGFRDTSGDAANPITLQRVAQGDGADLRMVLGEEGGGAGGENRFTIGTPPDDPATGTDEYEAVFEVGDDGHTEIQKDLFVKDHIRLDEEVTDDRLVLVGDVGDDDATALGNETGALYARAPSSHRWYLNTANDAGGSDAMQLDGTGLELEGRIHLSDLEGDRLVMWGDPSLPQAVALGVEDTQLFSRATLGHLWYIDAVSGSTPAMKLDVDRLSVEKPLAVQSGTSSDADKVILRDTGDAADLLALGQESSAGALVARAPTAHRWYLGGTGDPAMELTSAGLSVSLSNLRLDLGSDCYVGWKDFTSNQGWASMGTVQAGAQVAIAAATQALYVEVQLLFVGGSAKDSVIFDLRALGSSGSRRRMRTESVDPGNDWHNDRTFHFWLPKPTNVLNPLECRVEGMAGASDKLRVGVRIIGSL